MSPCPADTHWRSWESLRDLYGILCYKDQYYTNLIKSFWCLIHEELIQSSGKTNIDCLSYFDVHLFQNRKSYRKSHPIFVLDYEQWCGNCNWSEVGHLSWWEQRQIVVWTRSSGKRAQEDVWERKASVYVRRRRNIIGSIPFSWTNLVPLVWLSVKCSRMTDFRL